MLIAQIWIRLSFRRAVPTDDVPFGYKGRISVMEQLVVSENIQKFLRGDVEDVYTEAIGEGCKRRWYGDATSGWRVEAALRGETTLEEVSRVI
ncbi:hypothetical protein KOY49_03010 [Candidatus Minimicrobia vallesae]|uniref:Uncharacterized protein n=1 Tax=Candidatus Minimicrobia vallesae TaxID=2841264 RepID=A0A8F1M946_9BACT|nr:hypothetical protein [Candidatus Minimicrobia vallesae]QWQ31146.1 hypothetical protein KOY49_03010 [Candidatus Minimicrobia vallesae]